MSEFGITAIDGAGIAIIAVHNIKNGKDPFPSLLAGSLFTLGNVAVGALNTQMGIALAALFFISCFLLHGVDVTNMLLSMVSSKKG